MDGDHMSEASPVGIREGQIVGRIGPASGTGVKTPFKEPVSSLTQNTEQARALGEGSSGGFNVQGPGTVKFSEVESKKAIATGRIP